MVNSYSVGAEPCSGVSNTPDEQQIHSRYYPGQELCKLLQRSALGVVPRQAYLIDKKNLVAATCTCDLVRNLGAYVIVTSHYTPATCTTGIISSAAIPQIEQASASWKEAKVLMPFLIDVLNK